MRIWNKIGQAIDASNEGLGRVGWFLVLFLMSFGLYDVIMRYLFNSPSLWIWIILQQGMVMLAAIAGGYAFYSFVKLDLLYNRFSTRGKALADILTFSFTLLYCVVLIWKGIEHAEASIAIRQATPTAIRLPIYHLKAMIPVGVFFFLLVAVKKFVYDVRIVFRRETE